jgi:uncharacterized lipoprotein YddW (UPF0748 family)
MRIKEFRNKLSKVTLGLLSAAFIGAAAGNVVTVKAADAGAQAVTTAAAAYDGEQMATTTAWGETGIQKSTEQEAYEITNTTTAEGTGQGNNQNATGTVGDVTGTAGNDQSTTTQGNLATTEQTGTTAQKVTTAQQVTTTTKAAIKKEDREFVKIPEGEEFKAVWISFIDFEREDKEGNKIETGYTEEEFTAHVTEMFEKCKNWGMNAVVVHVRPFGDAFYPSKYYPWSKYVSGKQGVDPGYDPLEIMIEKAHELGLQFHAWLNPYRVANDTDISALSKDNKAKKWLSDFSTSNDRYVLQIGGRTYYNPSIAAVRTLVVNGVKEIVRNYNVDGIHFDDYFYPSLGTNYKGVFDYKEYNTYKAKKIKAGVKSYYSIINWRRYNVSQLVKRVYSAVKDIDEDVVFGIAPQGNMANLYASSANYCDVKKWMNNKGYVDYLCPEIYWGFRQPTVAFNVCLHQWLDAKKATSDVKLYIGIPTYRAGIKFSNEPDFKDNKYLLADMLTFARGVDGGGKVDGFVFYDYKSFEERTAAKTFITNMLKVLNK